MRSLTGTIQRWATPVNAPGGTTGTTTPISLIFALRSLISSKSLSQRKTRAHVIGNWCRIVPNKFVNAPLSAQGSVLNEVGGRFNISSIDETLYSKFPLYVGEDFEAAFREIWRHLQVTAPAASGPRNGFCAKDSFSVFSLSGRIESVLDINDPSAGEPFVNLISRFRCQDIDGEGKAYGFRRPVW